MIAQSQKRLKKFEFLNFEFPYQSNGVLRYCYFHMVGFA